MMLSSYCLLVKQDGCAVGGWGGPVGLCPGRREQQSAGSRLEPLAPQVLVAGTSEAPR